MLFTATCFDSDESSSGYPLNHTYGIKVTVHICLYTVDMVQWIDL